MVITAGELAAVRSDNVPTDLFVVYDIRLVEFAPGEFRAEGGQIYQERNWTPGDDRLKPTQYEYAISLPG